jgi:dephospho-CoA kinase
MGLDGSGAARVLLGGGIGAGKSTVAEVFSTFGFYVIDADEIGTEVLAPETSETRSVAQLWPEAVLDGMVNRQALAGIVFSNEEALRRLEDITHPAIAAEIERLVASIPGLVLVEIPLQHLVISGDWFRIAVVADEDVRVARAVTRGGDAPDVRRRVESQMSDEEWVEWADVVIDNGGAWAETLQSIEAVIDEVTG